VELVISASYESVVDAIVSGGADIARLGPASISSPASVTGASSRSPPTPSPLAPNTPAATTRRCC
jgi:ABC-type nitrate/sulfonate/bicarbonate transport system substrate-binding protein